MTELEQQMAGYRLTTAEIIYHMPDCHSLLQSFVWQALDLAPKYPVLTKFLEFWEAELDGKLHSVSVGSLDIIAPADFRNPGGFYSIQ